MSVLSKIALKRDNNAFLFLIDGIGYVLFKGYSTWFEIQVLSWFFTAAINDRIYCLCSWFKPWAETVLRLKIVNKMKRKFFNVNIKF